jgi:hypothetical protein
MASTPSGTGDGSGSNRSSRVWIIVIGCLIVVALAAAMLMRSAPSVSRPPVQSGSGQSQH